MGSHLPSELEERLRFVEGERTETGSFGRSTDENNSFR